MKRGFWPNFFRAQPQKPFAAWQIELTSRCPLRCRMCPKEENQNLPSRHMNLPDFRKLLPYLKDVEAVVLEGWGESLLHKNLVECIQLAKKEGPRVGFVSSGMGLNEAYISELIRVQVDFIGFSLSGATRRTHNAIRVNSDLEVLLKHVQVFQEQKARQKCTSPQLHIVYLLLKENIRETPLLVQVAEKLGIQEVVLINLIQISNSWQDEQKVFESSGGGEFEKILQEAETMARQRKIRLRRPSLSFRDVPVCSENPLRNLYVSTEGEVSPCVYLHPPLPFPFKRLFQGQEVFVEKVDLGNLFREPFQSIWNRKPYQEFRDRFARRAKRFEELASSLWTPDQRRPLDALSLPDAPGPCQSCYKLLGL